MTEALPALPPDHLTVRQAAEALGRSPTWVRNAIVSRGLDVTDGRRHCSPDDRRPLKVCPESVRSARHRIAASRPRGWWVRAVYENPHLK